MAKDLKTLAHGRQNVLNNKLDLVRGALIGGAAGDALGYPVEFLHYGEIVSEYGMNGITSYQLTKGVAEISDDTQMTLFTANGMLMGLTRSYMRGIGCAPEYYVDSAYQDWYYTQVDTYENRMTKSRCTWLSALPQLYSRRAPGNTCLTAIREMLSGHTPQNNSKGCGGVMRVSPWPLFCACHEVRYAVEDIDVAGGEIARLTHKHPLGWIPAILLTHILYKVVANGTFSTLAADEARSRFSQIVEEGLELLPNLKICNNVSEVSWDKELPIGRVFPDAIQVQTDLVRKAMALARNNKDDIENIQHLGEGWVGEETLAIAIYAVARHIDNFEHTLVAAVNHDGDSDSTGAVAGNIIGAIVGYEAIPHKFKEHLELHDVILAISDDLHQGCIISDYDEMNTPEKHQWYERYCMMQPSVML